MTHTAEERRAAHVEEWRRFAYRQQGVCGRCRFDHDGHARPLLVARPTKAAGWLCVVCYVRSRVRRTAPRGVRPAAKGEGKRRNLRAAE